MIEKIMQLCAVEKELCIKDIREAVKKIADNKIGIKLVILLIHKLQENVRKIKFNNGVWTAIS